MKPIIESGASFLLTRFNWNFGTLGFLDRFHGTDHQFLETTEWKRHRTLIGLTPMSEQYPKKVSEDDSSVNRGHGE